MTFGDQVLGEFGMHVPPLQVVELADSGQLSSRF